MALAESRSGTWDLESREHKQQESVVAGSVGHCYQEGRLKGSAWSDSVGRRYPVDKRRVQGMS